MGCNKDLTSHTPAHHCNINDSRNDELIITGSTEEPKERGTYTHSRWNPTPEQTMVLEEVYSSGTRTPSTQQIREIASKLQKYGRIEGKNVFYWFQNHKSRERLKRRRGDQQGVTTINNVHEEPLLHKDNATANKDSSLSVSRRRGDHRVIHSRTCLSSSPTHPQNNSINDGKREENKRGLEEEKETTCQNQIHPSNTSDFNYHLIIPSQEEEQQFKLNDDEEEEEETRKNRTLDLFPVTENQETTGFAEKNTKTNQLHCNYCYYYEFMPLMN